MHILMKGLITVSALTLVGLAILYYLIRKAKPLPCERCGLRPTTEETYDEQHDLCEVCFKEYQDGLETED